jgi:drug/metabolite transporter (DMT)-like permease
MKPNYPFIELLLLAAIWGASFLFMRIGSPEFGAFAFMALRTLIASIFLLPLLYLKQQFHQISGYSLRLFIASLFNTAIPFVLFGYATQHLAAGTSSILNATTPIFTALVAYLWLKDRLTHSQTLGLIIGFIGVYGLVADKLALEFTATLTPTLAILGATCCYGIGANFTKRYLTGLSPLVLATASQVAASLVLTPLALLFLPTKMPSYNAIISVILLGIVCTAIAYILFFRLITAQGPSYAVSVTYLIPVFGLIWGTVFLDESITTNTLIGCATILLGVALTTGTIQKFLLRLKKRTANT